MMKMTMPMIMPVLRPLLEVSLRACRLDWAGVAVPALYAALLLDVLTALAQDWIPFMTLEIMDTLRQDAVEVVLVVLGEAE